MDKSSAEKDAEIKRRGEYILHLLEVQAVVMGLNEQDEEWISALCPEYTPTKICKICQGTKNVLHSECRGEETNYYCCKCYVEAGNAPADWHRDCMETANKIRIEERGGG
jgi:hypothetical protein